MSEMLLRLVCTAAVAAGTVLAPVPATAVRKPPESAAARPPGAPGNDDGALEPSSGTAAEPRERSVAELLTDLQRLYHAAGKATAAYEATEERLTEQRAETRRLESALARARLSLHDSRGAAGRLARHQYQNSTGISPYVRLLLARDPQHALDQGHVIGRLARNRADAVGRLTGREKRADELARRARRALDVRLALTERRGKERDAVRERLGEVEELLASLSPEELAALAERERAEVARDQAEFLASGALGAPGVSGAPGGGRTPSAAGDRAVRYAVEQIGKPYEWGAEGPGAYDCSGLTSEAWGAAGTPVPRTSQEQWARLERVALDELRPGDLVVYFPEATHVALYLGDGMVVQAPRPGARVKVSPIAANPVLGAVRPDPDGEPLRRYVPPELPEGATEGPDQGYARAYAPPAAPETSAR
ncbi:C40 family peptidase [Streptomyces sp. M2CJ-2]|uniref:C40 family peptidase n=1 Tax=Streptomyces sp. M2CJ-2 TaxID=2803948 RepID=UPI001924745C|nr:C40 family peptidase [Streptomyces sp. M2CJ-2]MBL3666652.1 C40 family peptidase [Streptomyces sp. M2CJ-2]